ncbi:MAG: hypothetical protein COT16_01015 [Elusimicrobia bacterium CG08_land_8_20_14_0_20_44_26]|nr:MAG: hypothetical protein COT16_01015 [Elusimicrobia bacterium CG08_land_8_20_14_0_20_44_26]
MIDIARSVLLGLVQGITEFLPVSSSGHLVILRSVMKSDSAGGFEEVAFLHLATLLSVLYYFRKDLFCLVGDFFKKDGVTARKTVWFLFVASVPAGAAGFFFKETIDRFFSGNSIWISLFFVLTSALLLGSDYIGKHERKLGWANSLIIGVFQAVSILPGVSRSGSTISAGVFCGLDRRLAVVFSFYMSIPAVLFGNILFSSFDGGFFTLAQAAGFAAAFLSGVFAVDVLVKLVKKAKLKYFGFYALTVAVVNLFLI